MENQLLQTKEIYTSLEVVESQMKELETLICNQQLIVEKMSKIYGNDRNFAYAEYAEFTQKKWNNLNLLRKKLLQK